jgi:hypothetical protein
MTGQKDLWTLFKWVLFLSLPQIVVDAQPMQKVFMLALWNGYFRIKHTALYPLKKNTYGVHAFFILNFQ